MTHQGVRHSLDHAMSIIEAQKANLGGVVDGLDARQQAYVRERLLLHVDVIWNRRFKRIAGRCRLSVNLIELSPNHDWDAYPGEFEKLVVHEYAHFLAGSLDGKKHHGPAWKVLDKNMGGDGTRCHDVALKVGFGSHTLGKSWMRCASSCTAVRHVRSVITRWINSYTCTRCGERFVSTNRRGARACERVYEYDPHPDP